MSLETVLPWLQQNMFRWVYVLLPLLICVTSVLLLDKMAPRLGLLDKPDARKRHDGAIPVIGGPAMYLSIALASLTLAFHLPVLLFLLLGGMLVGLGIADDKFDLPASTRLLVQALVAVMMIFVGGVQIGELGNLFGLGPIGLSGLLAILFTVVCTIGVINAINMIDGVDGLAGSILIVSFIAMAYVALSADNTLGARMLGIFSGALLGFLCFNARVFLPRAAIFMGDSGSMLMGLILAWFLINMTQVSVDVSYLGRDPALANIAPLSAVAAGWIFGLPLIDTVAVMTLRLYERRSPFAAGRDHLHHLLLDRGYSVNQTVLRLLALHTVLVTIGVVANRHAVLEPLLFWSFVLLVAIRVLATHRLQRPVRALGSRSES